MAEIGAIWAETAAKLRGMLNADTFDRWIAGIVPIATEDSTIRLGVANDVFCEWLDNNYRDLIFSTLADTTGKAWKIVFESGYERPPQEPSAAAAKAPAAASANPEDADPHASYGGRYNKRFTFDSFVVGENNKFAHAACSAVAHMPGKAYNPLFIHGGTGLGKTHLLQAIAQDILARRKRAKVEYLSSEEFANMFIDALRDHSLPRFRQILRNVDVLLIDDVHFFTGKEQFQEEFFHTFNSLYHAHKQIVLTSDRPPHEINGLEKRLVSRFEWGLTTEIQSPDLETRIAILRKKQADHAVKLDDETLQFIACRVKSNIRRLEGALIRLVSYASVTRTTITKGIAEELLQPILDEEVASVVSVDHIQKVVAAYYDVRLADMTSKRRPANIAFPRQIAMFFCRKLTDYSTPAIGEFFNRNHATVLHAVETVERRMSEDAEFRQAVVALERKMKS